VRNTYNTRVDETEMGILQPVLEAELLVLDDLGAEKTSEWVQETLGLVINSRYNARRSTIITTNLQDDSDSTNPNSFAFQIGARTRSRLVEMCDWIQIDGADERDKDREAAAARTGQWPTAPDNIKKSGLPPRTRGQARAHMRDKGLGELKWTGGKAGT
jgi:DNA replication protein DnaC